jgi:hypothetical protein
MIAERREDGQDTALGLGFRTDGDKTELLETSIDGGLASGEERFQLASVDANKRSRKADACDSASCFFVPTGSLEIISDEEKFASESDNAAILGGDLLTLPEAGAKLQKLRLIVSRKLIPILGEKVRIDDRH